MTTQHSDSEATRRFTLAMLVLAQLPIDTTSFPGWEARCIPPGAGLAAYRPLNALSWRVALGTQLTERYLPTHDRQRFGAQWVASGFILPSSDAYTYRAPAPFGPTRRVLLVPERVLAAMPQRPACALCFDRIHDDEAWEWYHGAYPVGTPDELKLRVHRRCTQQLTRDVLEHLGRVPETQREAAVEG